MANRFPSERVRPNEYENMSLLDAVNLMVQRSGLPEKNIASSIGKALSTLQREMRPEDEGAKLGIETLLPLIVACCGQSPEKAPEPLKWLASRLHFAVLPFDYAVPDAQTVAEEAMQDTQARALAEKLMLEGAHPDAVKQAYALLHAEEAQTAERYRMDWEKGLIARKL